MYVSIEEAKKLLERGAVVGIPTETVYGLAAYLYSEDAIRQVFSLKKRPPHNPLIIHVKDPSECLYFVSGEVIGLSRLIDTFWPGPLTVVVPVKNELIPSVARAALPTAAFRMPRHPLTLELLQAVSPLVAPSANLSGKPSATRPEHVEKDFGVDFPVICGKESTHGVESTILLYQDGTWFLGRKGAIPKEQFASVLGYIPQEKPHEHDQIICPGQLLLHYAPEALLFLSKEPYETCPLKKPYVLGFDDREYAGATKVFSLGRSNNPEEVAHRLYHSLRLLDVERVCFAWVDINVPEQGLWNTILERLHRASRKV